MDPFSVVSGSYAFGGWLSDNRPGAKSKEIVYSVHNKSPAKLRFALCTSYFPGDLSKYFSTGWSEIDSGDMNGRSAHIPRRGMYIGICVQHANSGAKYLEDGGFKFYVLDKSPFLIKQARTPSPLLVNCSGRPKLVSGYVHLVNGNHTFTIP